MEAAGIQEREEEAVNHRETGNHPAASSCEMWTVIDTNGIIFNRKTVKIHNLFQIHY